MEPGLALGGPHRCPPRSLAGSWAAGKQCRALTWLGQALPVTVSAERGLHTHPCEQWLSSASKQLTHRPPPSAQAPGSSLHGRGLCCGVRRPQTPRLGVSEPRTAGGNVSATQTRQSALSGCAGGGHSSAVSADASRRPETGPQDVTGRGSEGMGPGPYTVRRRGGGTGVGWWILGRVADGRGWPRRSDRVGVWTRDGNVSRSPGEECPVPHRAELMDRWTDLVSSAQVVVKGTGTKRPGERGRGGGPPV